MYFSSVHRASPFDREKANNRSSSRTGNLRLLCACEFCLREGREFPKNSAREVSLWVENLPAKTKKTTYPITAPPMAAKMTILIQSGTVFAGVTLHEEGYVKEVYPNYRRTLTQPMTQSVSLVNFVKRPGFCWDEPCSV